MQIVTEEALQKHEKALEDYPDALPTYETISQYIFSIRTLRKQVESLTSTLLEVEAAKLELNNKLHKLANDSTE